MQLFCPNCQVQLGVPDGSVGKKVRCPACQHVFVANAATADPATHVQADPAPPRPRPSRGDEEGPAAPPRRRREAEDEEETPRRRRRAGRDDDDEEDEGERPRRRRRHEEDDAAPPDWKRRASAKARRAALLMYASLGPYVLAILVSVIQSALLIDDIPPLPGQHPAAARVGQMIGTFIVGPAISLTFIVIIFLGATQLRTLRGRGLAITAVVLSFLAVLAAGLRIFAAGVVLVAPFVMISKAWFLCGLAFDIPTAFLMLLSGIMAVVALVDRDVQEVYARRRYR